MWFPQKTCAMDFSIYRINIKEADLSVHVFKHELI